MTLNPCCIPLKTGVRMVTHLSMALAICVGWSSLKMMSISLEVSSDIAVSPSSTPTDAINRFQQQEQQLQKQSFGSGEIRQYPFVYNNPSIRGHHNFPLLPPPPLPPHSPSGGGLEPFRIPYEYILFYNWHQQQQQLRQHHNLDNQPQQPHQQRYGQNGLHFQMQTAPRPHPQPPPLLPLPPTSPVYIETKTSRADHDDDDDKFFRSVLQQRKNLKERPSMNLDSRNSEDYSSLPTPSPYVQGKEEEERDQIPKDWSQSFRSDESSNDSIPVPHDHHFSGKVALPPAQLSAAHHHHHHLLEEERQQQQEQQHKMNRRMRMMMSTFPGEYSQRDGATPTSPTQKKSGAWKKQSPDFREQYAKVLLLCGLLALCTVIFQFFTSFLLLCFVDKGSNAAAQIWTAVNCSVVFCLATCLVLFICEGLSIPKYAFDETLYLSLVTVDSLLSIYFLWVVMAFI